jgi:coproporphyrinogen III oxidase
MDISQKKKLAADWFQKLRDKICCEFEILENKYSKLSTKNKFIRTKWFRDQDGSDGGYGEMSVMKGELFEKVGVNFSKVYGKFNKEFQDKIPGAGNDPAFWASGISVVAHMKSPHIPAIHMNTRFISTTKSWFGGGTDLNPIYENREDTIFFHNNLEKICSKYNQSYYQKYKKWCDEYFFIKHRNISRGVGGIFYDYLNSNNFENDFNFTKDVGITFLNLFKKIIANNIEKVWTKEEREYQLFKRSEYAEFNLIYDRGTKFGLMTGGNIDAILMSMPPIVKWK